MLVTPRAREGYYLTRDAMKWFWDACTTDPAQRAEHYASPLRSTLDQLKGLPTTLVITDEADVLRDEGEQYADRLREADVARKLAVDFLRGALHDG